MVFPGRYRYPGGSGKSSFTKFSAGHPKVPGSANHGHHEYNPEFVFEAGRRRFPGEFS